MKKSKIVPFHKARLDPIPKSVLTDGLCWEVGPNRRVEVWHLKDRPELCLRFFQPTNDGRISKLRFALTQEAATALLGLLFMQTEWNERIKILDQLREPTKVMKCNIRRNSTEK